MVTINEIHRKTFEKILFYAIEGFSLSYSLGEELLGYFSPAWVCREWRRMLLPKLYEDAFIRIRLDKSTFELLLDRSNIRLIVENGLSKYVWKLSITVPEEYITSGHLIELLDGQLFNKTNWLSVRYLEISEGLPSALTNVNQGEHRADKGDTISKSLHAYLPALTSISVSLEEDNSTIHPLSKLINLKLHQLSHLNLRKAPLNLTHHSFSSSLTYLTLRLSPGLTTLPYIYTPNLRTLGLFDIPPNFSWRCFHSESSDSFDFSDLESMTLWYSATSAGSKIAAYNNSSTYPYTAALRKIHMPKIKRLSLSNIPPSDAHLFAPHLLLHVDFLHISGSIDVLTQLGPRFPFSKGVSIRLSNNTVEDTQDYSTFTESIFSSFSVTTRVRLEVEHYIPVSINTVGWSSLKELNIVVFISRTTLYRLLSRLPVLEALGLKSMTHDDEAYHYDRQQGTSPYSLDSSKFSKTLQHFKYFGGTSQFPLVFNLDPLYEFITNVVTLKVVRVPEYYLQEVQDHFSQANIQDYPHIQEICFTESFEVFRSPRQ